MLVIRFWETAVTSVRPGNLCQHLSLLLYQSEVAKGEVGVVAKTLGKI